eukprot:scaffold40625_cov45-Phaeocystis_antarctica.AAC.2
MQVAAGGDARGDAAPLAAAELRIYSDAHWPLAGCGRRDLRCGAAAAAAGVACQGARRIPPPPLTPAKTSS